MGLRNMSRNHDTTAAAEVYIDDDLQTKLYYELHKLHKEEDKAYKFKSIALLVPTSLQ